LIRRPLLYFSIIFASGELAAYFAAERSSPALFLFWLTSSAFSACLAERNSTEAKRAAKRAALRIVLVFIAGACAMTVRTAELSPERNSDVAGSGIYLLRIVSVKPCRGGMYLDCESADSDTGLPSSGIRLRRSLPDAGDETEEDWLYGLIGCTAYLRAELGIPDSAGNPRTFDYRRYLLARGIGLTGKLLSVPSEADITDHGGCIAALRRWVAAGRNAFLRRLPETDRPFAAGVLFGDTTGLPEDELAEFRGNGTAHILAVSGLHIGILASLLARMRKRTGGSWTLIPCAAIILVYGEASCWSPSVVRASALAVTRMVGEVTDRPYDSTEAAAGVSLLIVALRPHMLFDSGFQMSFLALFSINFLLPYLRNRFSPGVSVMLAVQTAIVPYTAFVFNIFSPMGLILNIPIIFLTSVLTPLGAAGFFAELAAGIFPSDDPFRRALAALSAGVCRLIRALNHALFGWNKALARVPSPPLFALAALLAAIFLFASEWGEVNIRERRSPEMKRLMAMVLIIVTLLSAIAGQSPFDRADQVFLDVGQGDSLHIRCGQGTDILIDGGGSPYRNVGRDTLMVYLLRNGVGNVDAAFATHLHTDHYLGLAQLAEEYPVGEMITGGTAGDTAVISDDVRIRILWPIPENADSPDENFSSLVFMVEQKGIRTLVTGDLTEEGERAIIGLYGGTGELKCDVLKVAHHGSRFSTTEEFLDEADPLIALIGVGRNEYGHPSAEVLDRLERRGIAVYRTDIDGAVGIRAGAGCISVCTMRSRRNDAFPTEP